MVAWREERWDREVWGKMDWRAWRVWSVVEIGKTNWGRVCCTKS